MTPLRAPLTSTPLVVSNPDFNPPAEGQLRFVLFYHSVISDWNHGNAHFLRGIASELLERGRQVIVMEPHDAWSMQNMIQEDGGEAIRGFREAYPNLHTVRYNLQTLDLDAALDGADVVIVHEWSDHALVANIGQHHRTNSQYTLLFHDTHHRIVSKPEEMSAYDLSQFDGVLAFGNVIREMYEQRGWTSRAWTWHEAGAQPDTAIAHVSASRARTGTTCFAADPEQCKLAGGGVGVDPFAA